MEDIGLSKIVIVCFLCFRVFLSVKKICGTIIGTFVVIIIVWIFLSLFYLFSLWTIQQLVPAIIDILLSNYEFCLIVRLQ